MFKKSLLPFISALLVLFCLTGCAFDKAFTKSKAGQITIDFGSSARSAGFDKLVEQGNVFITASLFGDKEDSRTVKAENGASITFEAIPEGSKVYVEVEFYSSDGDIKKSIFKGKSDVIKIVPGPNTAIIKLLSPEDYEAMYGEKPVAGEFVISLNCESVIYSEGSRIIFTAKDKKGKAIPAENIAIELYSQYEGYEEDYLENEKINEWDPGLYFVTRLQNEAIVRTALPESYFEDLPYLKFHFVVSVEADGETYSKKFEPFEITGGERVFTQFEFSIDEDMIYPAGTVITCTAKTEAGIPIPADKIDIVLSARTHENELEILPLKQNEEAGCYTITREAYKVIITTAFDSPAELNRYYSIFIHATETYDKFSDSKYIVYEKFSPYEKPESTIVMDPLKTELAKGDVVTFTATYKDSTPVPGDNIDLTIYELLGAGNKAKWEQTEEGFSTGVAENGKTFEITTKAPNTMMRITVSVKKQNAINDDDCEYKDFYFTVKRYNIKKEIDISALSTTQITEMMTGAANQMAQDNATLQFIFTGDKDDDEFNLYYATMEALVNADGVDLTGYEGLIDLDYSGCGGTVVSQIPAETFKEISTIKVFKISPSTTSIGNYAFQGSGYITTTAAMQLDELDLGNVESIGVQAFFRLKVRGTLNIPKATSIGSSAFDYLEAGTVNLGSAEHLYDTSGQNETAVSIFSNSKIDTLIAPKLKTIGQQTFDGATIGNFQIPDSLILIGRYGFRNATIRNLTFESSEAANSWYIIRSGFTINGEYVTNTKIAQGIFKGTYNLDTLLALPESEGNIELLTAEQLKQEMTSDISAGYWFVR